MPRICIIDHSSHTLFVEDVTDEMLAPYNGSEQSYIDDNYAFEGDYSWDYIVDAQFVGEQGDAYDLNEKIEELADEDACNNN